MCQVRHVSSAWFVRSVRPVRSVRFVRFVRFAHFVCLVCLVCLVCPVRFVRFAHLVRSTRFAHYAHPAHPAICAFSAFLAALVCRHEAVRGCERSLRFADIGSALCLGSSPLREDRSQQWQLEQSHLRLWDIICTCIQKYNNNKQYSIGVADTP